MQVLKQHGNFLEVKMKFWTRGTIIDQSLVKGVSDHVGTIFFSVPKKGPSFLSEENFLKSKQKIEFFFQT